MKILVFDTETTGLLPRNLNMEKEELNKLPYIVQLSFIIYDDINNKLLTTYDSIVKTPDGVDIPEESSKIHGITNNISKKRGSYIKDVLKVLKSAIENVNCIVAHNFEFDINMISIECMRNDMEIDLLENDPWIVCTMRHSTKLCNIEAVGKTGYKYIKYPQLSELHNKLFNIEPNNLHNSLIDVIVCLRCFYMIFFKKDICLINRNVKALYRRYC
tara:strand:+ start:1092 stop:1739 length:648 start_codon:yes stop_codon:yes gene_type:complete